MYITSSNVAMQLRTQVHKQYRHDGPEHSVIGNSTVQPACWAAFLSVDPRSQWQVNKNCFTATSYDYQFSALVGQAWLHESRHLVRAIQTANSSQGDLYARLAEEVIANDVTSLHSEAGRVFAMVELHILLEAEKTHLEYPGNTTYGPFWRHAGSWFLGTLTVKN